MTTYVYNVWDDDGHLDEWTYDAQEARQMRQQAEADGVREVLVTRYVEVDGNVNTQDHFERMSDEQLTEA